MLRRKRSHPPHRPPTSYSSVFAQIEEIGWKQLVSATGDRVSCLTFRVVSSPSISGRRTARGPQSGKSHRRRSCSGLPRHLPPSPRRTSRTTTMTTTSPPPRRRAPSGALLMSPPRKRTTSMMLCAPPFRRYWVIEMHVYGVRFDLALHLQ
ncbi:hypothetical protein Zm00014a_014286 [Zea mays]|uniref:Uncharacterized protein n=2 Tax=Zea mays TaxID=4577 RepID=A0A3L6DVL5_MAIZE|nr:hypothetical protein Zm00014a_014286 [Zea mays]PWZ11855.1 hypothetical protein Zm00014a_014286 [Zea mays]PWZ11856.1 hypothetical protein Zm00014a_014286 [Zea mays]PWZ11857.1 hypothetical protein Zm00014a_014286 [Zea mays]PWZ11858.1 hypothetical protein Zm00014a_014286 [Zea mays]